MLRYERSLGRFAYSDYRQEFRPPKKGEQYFDRNDRLITATYDHRVPQDVKVELTDAPQRVWDGERWVDRDTGRP